jgi:5-methylcytosine-specific restriction endonuclease McrA
MPSRGRFAGFPYGSAAWKKLRFKALRRDGFKCACGSRERLTVDHIKTARDFPALAWSLDNLVTRCASCDNKRHREKGRADPGAPWGCGLDGLPLDPAHPWNQWARR